MPNKKKLYQALKAEGYDNFADESAFNAYVDNADNRKKLFSALKAEGYDNFADEKSFDEYLGYSINQPEDDAVFEANAERFRNGQPIERVTTQSVIDANPELGSQQPVITPYSIERASLKEQVASNSRKFPKMVDLPWAKPQGGTDGYVHTTDLSERLNRTYHDGGMESFLHSEEDEKIKTQYTPKEEKTTADVWGNAMNKFALTERGGQLQSELAQIQDEITNKYLEEFKNSDEYKQFLGKKYATKDEEYKANKAVNDLFNARYAEAINNDMQPYMQAYNNEVMHRYGVDVESGLNNIAKKEAVETLGNLSTSVNADLEKIEDAITSRQKAVRNIDWKPGVPSSRDDAKLSELRGQRTYLEGAKELIEDSQNILNAVEAEKDGSFFGGLGRGIRDKAFDIDTWTMGLSDLVGGLRLKSALEKAEKGENLTPAEQKLLDASVNNMAVNFYYRNDLGLGYQAGEITGQSIPFMLEFLVNPVSASGNAMAKRLLTYGLKRFGSAVNSKAIKAGTRLATDALASGGVTATTGMGHVLSGGVERLNRNYEYGLDEEGNLNVVNTHNMGVGEAFAKSATSAFLERQSEMIFNAFRGAPSLFKGIETSLPGGVNTFMNYVRNSRLGELWKGIKNNATMKELAKRTQFHGLGEEYLEEVYNNFANIPLGEMTFEEATDLENNIVTFLGLAPIQVMFSAIGGIGYGVERYKARRDLERTFGKMTEEQKRKLIELQEMGKLSTNKDIAFFLAETIKDESLTPEQKRAEIEYAYNLAKQNAIDEVSNTDVEDSIESENQQIDAATDPQTGMYGEVMLTSQDLDGNNVVTPANVFGEKEVNGELYLLVLPEGEAEKKWVRPNQYDANSYQKRPAEEVKAINEEMIREEAAQQAKQEAKYAPEVLNAQMQQGVPFDTPNAQIIPVAPMPEGNGWIVEEYALDTNNKVAKTPIVRELTNDEYRDMLQAQLNAEEAAQKQLEEQATAPEVVEENVAEEVTQPVQPAEEVRPIVEGTTNQPQAEVQPQAPAIPTKEDGSIDFVSYGKEGTFKTLGEKYGEKMPNKVSVTAKALAEDLKKAQSKLQKAEEAYDNAPIGREQKAEEARDKAKQELEAIQREANFWAEMDAEIKDAQARRESMLNPQAEVETSTEPMNVDEFVAQQLASGNIILDKEDYKKETGYGDTEANEMNGGAAKMFGENGMTIQEAGERLMEMDRENGTHFFDQDDSNAGRDALISVLSSVKNRKDLNSYIANNRAEQAKRDSEGLRNELEKQVIDAHYSSLEDYVLQMEAVEMENLFLNDRPDEIMAIFAEEAAKYKQSLNITENGQGTENAVVEGSDSVLLEEQPDDTGGIERFKNERDSERVGERPSQESEGTHASNETDSQIEKARAEVAPTPTEAQKEAGNYKKGHVRIDGYDITIENPKGGVRSGRDKNGKEWSVTMNNDYGYIRGTEAVDGDHIDVFLSDDPSTGNVFVVDQMNEDGTFDESKVMYGFSSMDEARAAYLSNYGEGWEGRIMAITEVSKEDFKKWIDSSHRKTKAFSEYKSVSRPWGDKEESRRKLLRERAREWGKALGVDVVILESIDEVTDVDTIREIQAAHAEGAAVPGWINRDGTVYFFMPDIADVKDVDETYIHEVVAHKGIPSLLGKERFAELCDKVWDMMPQSAKDEFMNYPGVNGNTRIAADEYIAHLAEKQNLTPEEKTVWDKILKFFRDTLDKALNGMLGKAQLTDKDLAELIRISYANLKSGAEGVSGEGTRFSAKKKRALETVSASRTKHHQTAISSADGAKVLNNLDNLAEKYENDSYTKEKTFIGYLSDAIEAVRDGSNSRYATFETKNGKVVTIRLADHNATVSNFDYKGEEEGISIVVTSDENDGIINDGNAHIVEFYYNAMKLRRADGKPLAEIVKSIKQSLYSGEFKDTTGLAERQEVNESRFRVVKDKNGKKSLVGLHNISESKLKKAIKQGGLANPSMAVIDLDKQSHVDYGDITLIAPSSLIDKKSGKNIGTYTADAWTPIYPNIEKRMSDKGAKVYSESLESVPSELRNKVRLYFNAYLEDGNTSGALNYWFLHDTGKNPPSLTSQSNDYTNEELDAIEAISNAGYYFGLNEEEKQKVLDLFIEKQGGKDVFDAKIAERIETMKNNLQRPDLKVFMKNKVEQKLQEIQEYGYDYEQVSNFYSNAQRAINNRGKIDEFRTFRNAQDIVNNEGLQGEFNEWLADKEEQFGVEEYLFVGYNNNGDRKYLPNTLENASKLMKKEGRAGATGLHGFNHFVATLVPNAGTLAQINKKKGNLSTQEEYDAFREKWGDVYHELAKQLQPDATGYADYGYYRLEEMPTVKNPKEYVKKKYGIELSDKFMKKYNEFVSAIKNGFPARYFETKFERPVYLNEFAAAVVPQGTSKDVVDALTEAGLPVEEYESGNNEARMAAVDKVSSEIGGIRFRFIGEKGARNLDKAEEATTRLDNLAVAREMESAEKDSKTIKMATGWERGADGLWRYEVDDNIDFELRRPKKVELKKAYDEANEKYYKLEMRVPVRTPKTATEEERQRIKDMRKELAKLRKAMNKAFDAYYDYSAESATLGEFLGKDNQLFKEYPELADYDVSFLRDSKKLAEGLKGSFTPECKVIWVDDARPKGDIKSTLVHEIQHAIQDIEGFAQGGTPAAFASAKYQAEEWKANFNKFINRYGFEDWSKNLPIEDWMKYGKEYKGQFGGLHRAFIDNAVEDEDVKKTLTKELDYVKSAYDKFYQIAGGMDPAYKFKDANEWYRSLSGEVESRNVQQRMGMTDEQRRNTLAESTEDVAREDQIFLKDGIESRETRFRLVNEPAVDYVSQANDVVEVPRDEVIYTMNNIANQLYKTSGRFMRQLYKYGTLGRVLKGEYAEIDQIKAKNEYDHAKPILEEYLNELVWMKYQATEAAQEVINDVISDVEYAMQYYKDLSLGKDVWRTQSSPRFRISEKGKQIQAEVDKFTSKYNSKPVVASEVNSMVDENIEDMFDADASEVKDAAEKGMIGGYDEKTDKIYIFAENQNLDDLEDTLFHENLHALFHGNAMIVGFDEASKDKFLKNRANIQKVYKEDMWAEEMFVKVAADAMAKGDFKYIEKYLPDEYKEEFYNTIKDFGYEREEESERRRTVRPGIGGQVEGQEVSQTRGLGEDAKEPQAEQLDPRERKERLTDLFNKVADMGLEGVLGNKEYTSAMVDIYKALPNEVRAGLADDALRNYGGSVAPAVSDYLNVKAEPSVWDKVVTIVREALRKVGFDFDLNTNEVRYMVWRSKKPLDRNNLLEVAEDIDMKNRLKVGEYDGSPTPDGGGTRFRVSNKLKVRDEYEATIKKGGYQAREAVQDAMLSLRKFQELIEKASGKKIRDFENAWMHENRLSSVVQAEIHDMERKFYKPMMDAVKKLMKAANLEQEQVADYLMLKHGIERNREMAVRKALTDDKGKIDRTRLEQWYQEKEAIRNDASLDTWRKKQEAMDNAALNYGADMSRDYSGLTSMFDTDDLADSTQKAYDEVEALENAHPVETESLGKAIKAMTQNTLDKSFESGLMDRKVYDELSKDMYDYYIPLRGFEETTSEEVYAYLDQDRGAFNAPLKRAKGRSSKSDNPIAYLKSIAESGIMQGNRNKMKQSFLNMVINHPSDLVSVREGVWVTYNPATGEWEVATPPAIPNDATPADVEAAMEAWEQQMEQAAQNDPTLVKKVAEAADVPYRVVGNKMGQHQIIVKRLGKSYTLTINGNPRLAMALNGQTNPNNTSNDGKVAAFVNNKIGSINRSLAAWYTTRNPDFVASNFMRDTFYTNTIVRAKEGNAYANKFHKNYATVLPKMLGLFRKYEKGTLNPANKTEAAFLDFMMNGGETGYSNLKDVEEIKKQISKELKESKWDKAVTAVGLKALRKENVEALAEKLDILNRAVENTARFAAYLTSREEGRSIAKSIYDAKEISVNFNKKGAGGTFFGMTGQTWFGNLAAMVGASGRALYVFFNAAIQGSTNLMHVMKVNPKGTSAGLAAMFLMGAVVPMLFAGDDDEKDYYDLPEHVRRNHLIIPGTGDAWVSIPLPIEYRIMYGMGELLTSWRTGHERGSDVARKMLSMTGQALPLNFLEEGLEAFVPSAISPIYQVMTNSSWTGLPIYKENDFNKDDPEYTKAYSNVDRNLLKFTKAVYEWTFDEENQEEGIDLNPAVIETLAKGYFGGLATQLSNLAKVGGMIAGEQEFDWRNIPIGNRVFKSGDERTKEKRITNEYFENMEKLEFLQSRERLLKKTINGVEVPEMDKGKAKIDDEIMRGSEVYQKYMEFKKQKKLVDKIRKTIKEKGSTPEREKQLMEAQEAANKAVR